jgi:hypothetical protein
MRLTCSTGVDITVWTIILYEYSADHTVRATPYAA